MIQTKFQETDIRPAIFKPEMKKALQEDLNWLQKNKGRFVQVNCPACDSSRNHFAFEKYSFNFVACNECDAVFMNPRAAPELLNQFYAQSKLYDYWNEHVFPASRDVRREKIFKPRVDRILEICEKFNISTHCLMDVGAGFGIFCEEVQNKQKFEQVIAVEPNANLAESCRKAGIETIEESIENIPSLNYDVDVLTCFEVIEHLFSPYEFLLNCRRFLSSQSIVAVTCPNYKGFDISMLGTISETIDAEHINLFNPQSIQTLFERSGYHVLECSTAGELDADIVHNKILDGELTLQNQPFLRTILIDRWNELGAKFQKFLQENQLSSNIWIVAQKK